MSQAKLKAGERIPQGALVFQGDQGLLFAIRTDMLQQPVATAPVPVPKGGMLTIDLITKTVVAVDGADGVRVWQAE